MPFRNVSLLTRYAKPFSSDTIRNKELLKVNVAGYRQKMEAQWQELQTDARHYGKQALVIGGVFAGVYVLMNALLPDPDEGESGKEKDQEKTVMSKRETSSGGLAMGKVLRGLAVSFAVGWARQKLSHYTEAEKKTDAQKER